MQPRRWVHAVLRARHLGRHPGRPRGDALVAKDIHAASQSEPPQVHGGSLLGQAREDLEEGRHTARTSHCGHTFVLSQLCAGVPGRVQGPGIIYTHRSVIRTKSAKYPILSTNS